MVTADSRVWLITGCSTGFGRMLAEQVLEKGEKLVATQSPLGDCSSHPRTTDWG